MISQNITHCCVQNISFISWKAIRQRMMKERKRNIHYLSSPKGMKIVWIVLPHHQQVDRRRKLIFLWRKESRVMNVWDVMYWSLVTSSLSRLLLLRRGRRSKIFVSSPLSSFYVYHRKSSYVYFFKQTQEKTTDRAVLTGDYHHSPLL